MAGGDDSRDVRAGWSRALEILGRAAPDSVAGGGDYRGVHGGSHGSIREDDAGNHFPPVYKKRSFPWEKHSWWKGGIDMDEILSQSLFFGGMLTLVAYSLGCWMKRKWKLAIFNPLLVGIVVVILFLLAFQVDYDTYNEGAKYISYFLTPATVCLALPLYQQFEALKRNYVAILAGIAAGAVTSAACVLGLSALFHFSHREYVTLLPKSITTAIGMGISEELGGFVTITVAVIVITGVLGNILAEHVCKWFHIRDAVAKGIAIGSSSHAAGTAKALEMGEVEGAMSGLSIAVSGLITVFLANIFANFY